MRRAVPPLALLALIALSACSAAGSAARPTDRRAPTPTAVPDSVAGPWRFRNLGHARTQRVTLRALLESRVDTVVRRDSVASETLLEWSVVPGATPLRAVGMTRAFAVDAGAGWQGVPELVLPVSFVAAQEAPGAQPTFVSPTDTSCAPRAAAVQAFRETWLAPPERVTEGTRWQDSTAYATCRDGIVLQVLAVRDYTVLGGALRDGRLVVRVRRDSRSQLRGAGLQFGDSVQIEGRAEGSATLELALDGAAIVSGDGRSALRLELRGRRRTQELVQVGALEIRLP